MAKTNKMKQKTVRIEVHFSEDNAETLSKLAELEGRSRKNFIEQLLLKVIQESKK